MKSIVDYVNGLEIGEIQAYKNVAVAPLMGEDSGLEYLLLEEALNKGLSVTESGSVPTLKFNNKSGQDVVILQGEYVEGGKQNRMVATSVYMAKGFNGQVPVNCVQAHRWGYSAPRPQPSRPGVRPQPIPASPPRARAFRASARRAAPGVMMMSSKGFGGQSEVWGAVGAIASSLDSHSPTADLGEIVSQRQGDVNEYLNHFSYVPGSVGMVVVTEQNGKKIYGADIFDQSKTAEKHFRKMIESYVTETLSSDSVVETNADEIKEFLDRLSVANFEERAPVSLGRDLKISGQELKGFAIQYNGTPVYITLNSRNLNETSVRPNRVPQPARPAPGPWDPSPEPAPYNPFDPLGLSEDQPVEGTTFVPLRPGPVTRVGLDPLGRRPRRRSVGFRRMDYRSRGD